MTDLERALLIALERAERHIVGHYRATAPFGNYDEENRFADHDAVVINIRDAIRQAKENVS